MVKRVPIPMPGSEATTEIHPVFKAENFGDEFTPELREQEPHPREQAEAKPVGGAAPTIQRVLANEANRTIDAVWRIESYA